MVPELKSGIVSRYPYPWDVIAMPILKLPPWATSSIYRREVRAASSVKLYYYAHNFSNVSGPASPSTASPLSRW